MASVGPAFQPQLGPAEQLALQQQLHLQAIGAQPAAPLSTGGQQMASRGLGAPGPRASTAPAGADAASAAQVSAAAKAQMDYAMLAQQHYVRMMQMQMQMAKAPVPCPPPFPMGISGPFYPGMRFPGPLMPMQPLLPQMAAQANYFGTYGEANGAVSGYEAGDDTNPVWEKPKVLPPVVLAQREARLKFEHAIFDKIQGVWWDDEDGRTAYTVDGNVCIVSDGSGGREFRNRLSVYGVDMCWDARRFWHVLELGTLPDRSAAPPDRLVWNPARDSPPTRQIVWVRTQKTTDAETMEANGAVKGEDVEPPEKDQTEEATQRCEAPPIL